MVLLTDERKADELPVSPRRTMRYTIPILKACMLQRTCGDLCDQGLGSISLLAQAVQFLAGLFQFLAEAVDVATLKAEARFRLP